MAKKVKKVGMKTTELKKLRKWQIFVIPYRVLCTVVDDSDKEKIVVRRLAAHLKGGEWFGIPNEKDIILPGSTRVQVGDLRVAGTRKGDDEEVEEKDYHTLSVFNTDAWKEMNFVDYTKK